MSTLTVRQVSDETHARLRLRAAEHGRSVEAEVRAILDAAVEPPQVDFSWRDRLLAIAAEYGDPGGIPYPERTGNAFDRVPNFSDY